MTKKATLLPFSVFKTRGEGLLFRNNPKPGRCAAGIHGDRTAYWQCQNKGTKEYGGFVWCMIHHPPIVDAKKKARDAKWQAERAAKDAKWKAAELADQMKDRALDAIKLIAAGHNDPRALARSVLAGDGKSRTAKETT